MELLGPESAPEGGPGGDDLFPEPNAGAPATTQDEKPGGDSLVDVGGERESEGSAGRTAPENGAAWFDTDEPLDPGLLQLFVEANNEARESAAASELPDIPIRDLLSELVSLSQSLGIERPPAAADPVHEEGDSPEPEPSPTLEAGQLSVAGLRRHALHGLLLSLTLTIAIASALVGADRLASSGMNQEPTPTASATATAHAGVVVSQIHPSQPTPEPAPESPRPAPARQPAYFVYTVRSGDTLSTIATAFGLSLDHVLWANPDTIDDPNLLLAGDKILIPGDAGMIYYVKPGNILSVLGRLLPDERSGNPGATP